MGYLFLGGFLMIFGGPGPIREPSWNQALKKVENTKIGQPLFGRLFGVVLLKKQILEHFCGMYFLAHFCIAFRRLAAAICFHVEAILGDL